MLVHLRGLQDVVDDLVEGIRSDEALGSARVDQDPMHLVALDEVEGVERGVLLRLVSGMVYQVRGLDVGAIFKNGVRRTGSWKAGFARKDSPSQASASGRC